VHAQLVACDLIDQKVASEALASSIKQHRPNRQRQVIQDAAVSSCVFFAERSSLITKLLEFQNPAEALRAFEVSAYQAGTASFTPETGLGERAAYWRIGNEASGLTVVKGKYVFALESRWKDSNSLGGSKERLRQIVQKAISSL